MDAVRSILGAWRVPALLAAALAAGCATAPVPLGDDARAALRSAPLVRVVHAPSVAPVMTTPKDAVGGGLMAIATKSQDLPSYGELARRHRYPDPTALIGDRLLERLQAAGAGRWERVAAPLPPMTGSSTADADLAQALRQRFDSGLVLAVDMRGYWMGYLPMNWQTYRYTMFGGTATLYDAGAGKTLWRGTCSIDLSSRTIDVADFQANDGARAQQFIADTARACADDLVQRLAGG